MDNPYPICKNCIFVDEPLDKDPCQECNRAFLAQRIKPNFVSKRKPQTNADRIRAMTDEELAEYLCKTLREAATLIYPNTHYSMADIEELNKDWLDWLKQEVKE